jgi:hypothetical protein
VTAEVALALPGLAIVTTLLLLGIVVAGQQVRCRDAASAVARAVARGETADDVDALARAAAPKGAKVEVRRGGGVVVVRVTWRPPARESVVGRLLPVAAAEATVPEER